MNVMISTHGPVFDGRAERIASDAAEQWCEAVAETGSVMMRANLNMVLRHQTPYYRTRIQAEQRSKDTFLITDQGVVYGPWLEGVGSRNRTTRFKGYFTFRRTCQQLVAKARQIGEPIIRRAVERINA